MYTDLFTLNLEHEICEAVKSNLQLNLQRSFGNKHSKHISRQTVLDN